MARCLWEEEMWTPPLRLGMDFNKPIHIVTPVKYQHTRIKCIYKKYIQKYIHCSMLCSDALPLPDISPARRGTGKLGARIMKKGLGLAIPVDQLSAIARLGENDVGQFANCRS